MGSDIAAAISAGNKAANWRLCRPATPNCHAAGRLWAFDRLRRPLSNRAATQGAIGQMRGRSGADADFRWTGRALTGADAFDPVREVEHLAIGFVIEIRAARTIAEDQLAWLELAAPLWMNFIAAPVDIERRFASHELAHRAIASIDKRSLKVGLHSALRIFARILHYRLDRVGRFPQAGCLKMIADARGG